MDRRAIGVIKVVNNTNYNEIPSTPKFIWQKFNWLNSDTNWNWVVVESNSYHKNKDMKKLIKEVVNAIIFIWFLLSNVLDIGNIIKEPIKGINSNNVNIVLI